MRAFAFGSIAIVGVGGAARMSVVRPGLARGRRPGNTTARQQGGLCSLETGRNLAPDQSAL